MGISIVELINQRISSPRLTEPVPNKSQLEQVFKSALRAPDHMMLRPWRYLIIEGEARSKLGDLFLHSAMQTVNSDLSQIAEEVNDFKAEKLKSMPMRSPMIIVAISSLVDHPKVPHQEQILSCGVGVGYMLLSLQALGYGGIWRTGDMAFNRHVCDGLGLKTNESIIGFLYIGTPVGEAKPITELNVEDYFSAWK